MRLPANYTAAQMQKICRWNAGFGKGNFLKKKVCVTMTGSFLRAAEWGKGRGKEGWCREKGNKKGKYIIGHWRLKNRNV